MQISLKNLPTVLFLVVSLFISASLYADRQEPQVQLESRIVEVSDSQTRELGVDWNRDSEIARTRSLERLVQSGNLPQNQSVFDFKPLVFTPPQPAPTKTVSAPTIIPIFPQVQNTSHANTTSPLNLSVTPQVQPDGNIDLKLRPQTATLVQVPDGKTAVLGGLIQENSEKSKEKVPLLGKIPMLGRLFRQGNQSEKKELMIFVTPTVQSSD